MTTNHVIDDAAFDYLQESVNKGRHFVVYDSNQYFIERGHVEAFALRSQAEACCLKNPDPGQCIIYAPSIVSLLEQLPYGNALLHYLSTVQTTDMNNKNLEYLDNQLKYAGYASALNNQLRNNINAGKDEFVLIFKAGINNDQISSSLNFTRSKESDFYFFNRHTIALTKEGADQTIRQTFYMGRDQHNITLREGYNLLDGRSVFKEDLTTRLGDFYDSWIRIDRNQTTPNGNFKVLYLGNKDVLDVGKELKTLTIPSLVNEETRDQLIKALERGNIQRITIVDKEQEIRVSMEASPETRAIIVTPLTEHLQIKETAESPKTVLGKPEKLSNQVAKKNTVVQPGDPPTKRPRRKNQKL